MKLSTGSNRKSSKGELMFKKLKADLHLSNERNEESPASTIISKLPIGIAHVDNAESKSSLEQSEIDENISVVIKTFKNLDVLLMSFRRKNKTGSIKNISDSFLKLFGTDFKISIISTLLFLSPFAYNVAWEMSTSGEYELMISFPTENIILSDRLQHMRKAIVDSLESLSWSSLISRAQANYPIPPKPQCVPDQSLVISPVMNKPKRPQTLQNELILKRPRVVESYTTTNDNATTLDELKQQAAERRLQNERDAARISKEKESKAQQATTNLLPALSSTLRSYCMIDKKFSMISSTCVSKLASDFRLSKGDIRRSLRILMDEFPEFITETQPDSLVPFATIKVNSAIDFSSFHKGLVSFARNSTVDRIQ